MATQEGIIEASAAPSDVFESAEVGIFETIENQSLTKSVVRAENQILQYW